MNSQNFLFVREELKRVLKSREIKYGVLAKRMGLSESGIKKMLNGKDLSFNKISDILSCAQISVTDFFQTIDEGAPTEARLTSAQEEHFLKCPNDYYFFHQLLGADLNWKELKKRHGLSQKSVDQYLLRLDKIRVIELHPGNLIKSTFAGNCRLSFGMKLMKLVVDRKHQDLLDFAHIPNEKFRGRKYVSNGSLKMKAETASEFAKALKDVITEYMNRSRRECTVEPNDNLEDIGFLILTTPTEGMPLEAIPNF